MFNTIMPKPIRCLIFFSLSLVLSAVSFNLVAQETDSLAVIDYSEEGDYEIGGITVSGANYSDDNAIISISGLATGDKVRIPGNAIPTAIRNLWKLRLFTDVQIVQTKLIDDVIFLEIQVEERPRLSRYSYQGVPKSKHDALNEAVDQHLLKGGIVTENVKSNAARSVEQYFIDKGFLDASVRVLEYPDSSRVNSVRLVFDVNTNDKVKIKDIEIVGNEFIADKKLIKQFTETKEKKKLFASSKLLKEEYEADKQAMINYYNTRGFRDARVTGDSIWRNDKGELMIKIFVDEGNRYYFRNLEWKGNSIYDEETLNTVLGIRSGDVYNNELLEQRLQFSQDGRDIGSLYQDNGYLFFNVDPVEVAIEDDSIDMEFRIFEGPQATIDKVTIAGNDRTHEHVIRRELRTRPGQKFSRSDIIRSQREIINLGYFNPETLELNTPVNPQRGTVDIEYQVEERPADQLELSAGWGGQRQVIGTLGVSFNNFSLRNIFNPEAWRPLPMGDGQSLSLRAQTNGQFFQSYNFSFTEPWLGGKKPNSFTLGGFYNRFAFGTKGTSSFQSFRIIQGSVSLGTRLQVPDDNFIYTAGLNLQTLALDNWSQGLFQTDDAQRVTEGTYYNFSLRQTIARSTISDPIFPREGSRISLTLQLTPPYSLFNNKDYSDLPVEERFEFLEYHKWRFDAEWYTPIAGDLILKIQAKIGILGSYNEDIGTSPFERFQLGGDGINNQQFGFAGVDIISMRGYDILDFEANRNPSSPNQSVATPVFDKFTIELRYPLTLQPSSSIYLLAFAQGGNAWRELRDFNPFDFNRSVGAGLRVFLPMFGTLGFDYGIGFDKNGPQTLNNLATFNIVLGFEPE